MTRSDDCPYCNPQIEHLGFLESDHFRAIYNPVSVVSRFGIVVPQKHIKQVTNLNSAQLGEMMNLGKQAVRLLRETFHAGSYRWMIQGVADKAQISHIQIHLVPEENSMINLETPMDQQLEVLGLPKNIEKFTTVNDEVKAAIKALKEHTGQDIPQPVLQQ